MKQKTALMADPVFREHLDGRRHPECPERLDAVMAGLAEAGLMSRMMHVEARAAQMVTQYPWINGPDGPLRWRRKGQ